MNKEASAAGGIVKLVCPQCGRFLADVRDFGHAVCAGCGSAVTYHSRAERRRIEPRLTGKDSATSIEPSG
jgi:predicted amidophosphoribosyltransferase